MAANSTGAAQNDSKSVSIVLKQRQQSRSATIAPKPGSKGSVGPGGSNPKDNLDPVPPPLYPPAAKAIPLNAEMVKTVKDYQKLTQYFKSNFCSDNGASKRKMTDEIYLERYTDQYDSPFLRKPHLMHKLSESKLPVELTRRSLPQQTKKRVKRKVEDLPDADETVVKKEPNATVEEDEEEEKEEEVNQDVDEVIFKSHKY